MHRVDAVRATGYTPNRISGDSRVTGDWKRPTIIDTRDQAVYRAAFGRSLNLRAMLDMRHDRWIMFTRAGITRTPIS